MYVYSLKILGKTYKLSQNTFSFLTIFDGFFLTLGGYGLQEKTRAAWFIVTADAFLTFALLIISYARTYHIVFIGAIFDLYLILTLIKRRSEFVYPSKTIGRPEVGIAILTVLFTIAYGVGGSILSGEQFKPPIRSLGTALYYTGETVTTLGFGDILPVDLESRLFTISLAFLGVAIFFSAMTALITPTIERRVGGLVNRMEKRELMKLKDFVLVCGYSPLLSSYLLMLKQMGKVIVIVEKDPAIAAKLRDDGYIVLNQEADDQNLLSSFTMDDAYKIIIGPEDDAYSLIIAATLRQVAGEKAAGKTRVIVYNTKNVKKFSPFGYGVIDLPKIVSESLPPKQS
ncbi:potassium channel protein [Thermoplasma volcanium GSS1]|uniref:Potassium channel protein n=1 Tax=Thermoplasma volcanium (strain ATCC 51530 / DSM 4299 / JCM 9571 / NBRC 15438 / GSS1) TaxID=273116 RepID=Q97CK5_THEVO|nr:NAD-binding protein [Thermoplasma volcanium]BAB59238.1 potassium channel protein [Thermoplasma volcanium GSS1]